MNGVTVDSTEDFSPRGGSLRVRRSGRLTVPGDDDIRRRSWCPDTPRSQSQDAGDLSLSPEPGELVLTGKR